MRAFRDLPAMVLGPLEGRPPADWIKAPTGKWTPAQIVNHVAMALDFSSRSFESRASKPPMKRRPRKPYNLVAGLLIMRLGWFPPGRKAPAFTTPPEQPVQEDALRLFNEGFNRFLELERTLLPARRHDLFATHPALGDLTLEEFMRFHVIHSEHHARQIRDRLSFSS